MLRSATWKPAGQQLLLESLVGLHGVWEDGVVEIFQALAGVVIGSVHAGSNVKASGKLVHAVLQARPIQQPLVNVFCHEWHSQQFLHGGLELRPGQQVFWVSRKGGHDLFNL
jgi:hypothetical protein